MVAKCTHVKSSYIHKRREVKLKLKNLVLLIVVTFTSLARAQLTEPILGIQLGQPFKIVQCAVDRNTWCRSEEDARLDRPNPSFVFLSPPDVSSSNALPTWVKLDKTQLELRSDGVAEKFYVKTFGPSVQDRVVDSISGRFGKPTTYEKQAKQNAMGASVDVVFAIWQTADAVITHGCSQINSCTVIFYTTEAYSKAKLLMEQRKQRDKL